MLSDKELRELVAKNLDAQARARDFSYMELPGYMEWSERKLSEGESPAFIANIDSQSVWLLPEEVEEYGVEQYEEALEELKSSFEEYEKDHPPMD